MVAFAKNMVERAILRTELNNKFMNPREGIEVPSWEVLTV